MANDTFTITARVVPITSDIQSQLDAQTFNIPINIGTSGLNNIGTQVQGATQTAQAELDKMAVSSQQVSQSLDAQNNVVRTTIKETKKIGEVTEKTTKVYDKNNKLVKQTATTTNDYAQAQKRAEKEARDRAKAEEKLQKELKEEAEAQRRANEEANKSTIGAKIKSIGQDFVTTTAKVAKFALSTALIGVFTNAVSQAKEAVVEFDKALTDYKKVSDLSGQALQDYTEQLGKLGEQVARTRKHFSASVYSNMHRESI